MAKLFFFLFLLGSAACNALGNILLKKWGETHPTAVASDYLSGKFLCALAFWCLGLFFYSRSVRFGNITSSYSLLVAFSILMIAFLSTYFLHQKPTPIQYCSMGIILAGVALFFFKH